ncbi:valine--tRNA ligase-like [Anopheles cruzii]|uniref:valine--tRNA ligase-like n=1 Tax=Anopheles cruzii TaxID=68878 RepID=UPI0022EC1C5C|nr:valine--tRNA ligase-like [Anopheles cruzii]
MSGPTAMDDDDLFQAELVETEKQFKKEAKKAAKLAKLAKLQEKLNKKQQQEQQSAVKPKTEKKVKETKEAIMYGGTTREGEKKDLTGPFPDAYSPQYVEAAWYSWWEKEGFFKTKYGRNLNISNGQFVMVIPSPNVTGSLHMGHALTNAIEDAITRWHRMKGHIALFVPRCHNSRIAFQLAQMRWRKGQQTRRDLEREKFIDKIWQWRNEKGDRIYHWLKRVGSSFDWDRGRFEMDPKMCKAVTKAFVRMHERGLIYRSSRLVNWSCTLRSAISDIEVDKVELAGRTQLSIPGYTEKVEFGVLVSFAYKVCGSQTEEIVVATTRVETMLGDTAVAVHPNDDRYKHLHGKFVQHPFCARQLPIVCDEFVEREFGTGAVPITPAHGPNDFKVGKRHNLPFVTIFTDDGVITGDYGPFTGMKRFDARKAILTALQERGLYRDTKDNPMVVPVCSRSKDIVEPLIKPQWYVRCSEMAASATEAVRSGKLIIVPAVHRKTWYHWMDEIRDWCVSSRLGWGYPIPAYQVNTRFSILPSDLSDENRWFVGRSEAEALRKAASALNVKYSCIMLQQDEDMLDRWFSSGLSKDPTLATRVFCEKLFGEPPLRKVLLHPMVRDAHGRKMSESLGNVIHPMDVILGNSLEGLHEKLLDSNLDPRDVEKAKAGQKQDYPNGIPECGKDALRFALCANMTQARVINLDINRVQGYRFFCNKLWNATKFALMYFSGTDTYDVITTLDGAEGGNIDRWILSRLAGCIEVSNRGFEKYEFALATNACYNFWLYDLCDVYLECLKCVFQTGDERSQNNARRTLYTCLNLGLKLLSPFMPFITEELYQRLPRGDQRTVASICVAPYPEPAACCWKDESIEKGFEFVQKTARDIRSARSDYNIPNKTKTDAYFICADEGVRSALERFGGELETMAYSTVHFGMDPPAGCAILTITGQCVVHLMLNGLIEVDKEIEKMIKKRETLTQTVAKLQQPMSVSNYTSKVPEDVRKANQEKLNQLEVEIERLNGAIDMLKMM